MHVILFILFIMDRPWCVTLDLKMCNTGENYKIGQKTFFAGGIFIVTWLSTMLGILHSYYSLGWTSGKSSLFSPSCRAYQCVRVATHMRTLYFQRFFPFPWRNVTSARPSECFRRPWKIHYYIAAPQSKNAASTNIKHSRYTHLMSNFLLIHFHTKSCMCTCLI